MTPTAADLNRGVAAAREALVPLTDTLADRFARALRDLAASCAADLEGGVTAAAAGPWQAWDPDMLWTQLRSRHSDAWLLRHSGHVMRVEVEAMRRTYDGMGAALGVSFSLTNPVIDGQVRALANRSTLPDSSWEVVRESLQRSHDAGEGIPQAARRLRTDAGGIAPARSRTIARTELVGIANRGSITAARLVGIGGYKTWLATGDARTRDAHALANGQTVRLDDTFAVMGEALDYPGDPVGSPANIINCRCTVTYGDTPDGFTGDTREAPGDVLGPVPDVPAAAVPQGPAVSASVEVGRFTKARRADVDAALANIDRLHALPDGREIRHRLPIEQGGKTKGRGAAYFQVHGMGGISPLKIRLNVLERDGRRLPAFDDRSTLTHELGHFLDHWHLPGVHGTPTGSWSSTEAAVLARRTDPAAGAAVEALDPWGQAWVGVFRAIFASPHYTELLKVQGRHGQYLRSPEELWARTYTQWVGTRTADPIITEGIAGSRARRTPETDRFGAGLDHWPDDEFKPIADAMDALFRAGGMLHDAGPS